MHTKEITIYLPGLTLPLLVPRDVEELIADPADEESIPLWAEVWPAARGLAQYIWTSLDFTGMSVLELGAGAGLPGIVCGLKGASVTFSDRKPEALELAETNARLSGVKNISCFLADWRNFHLNRRFDWIIGSDILYDPKFHSFLAEIFQAHLKPGGHLLISHPGRPATFRFAKDWQSKTGCLVFETIIPVSIEDPYFPHYNIHIHHFFRLKRFFPAGISERVRSSVRGAIRNAPPPDRRRQRRRPLKKHPRPPPGNCSRNKRQVRFGAVAADLLR